MENPIITKEHVRMKVIYIRFQGTYLEFRKNSRKMFNRIFSFAEKNNLVDESFTKVLTIYHDNPYITEDTHLRTSVAMTVPLDASVEEQEDIGVLEFSGNYAILQYELKLNEYDKAWNETYHKWILPDKSLRLRDTFPFEMYVSEPPRNMKSSSTTSIFIPIE